LIPTPQGEAILGTTVDYVGYEKRSTNSGIQSILRAVSEVVLSIGLATMLRTWAGLRPAISDELSLIGRHPALDGLIVATGHYRSGILLVP